VARGGGAAPGGGGGGGGGPPEGWPTDRRSVCCFLNLAGQNSKFKMH
jgi:hypothetical protein